MSLEAAIHARWSSDLALTALVPAAHLFTGAARGAVPLPYVVLMREAETARTRTSSHTEVSDLTVRFEFGGAADRAYRVRRACAGHVGDVPKPHGRKVWQAGMLRIQRMRQRAGAHIAVLCRVGQLARANAIQHD